MVNRFSYRYLNPLPFALYDGTTLPSQYIHNHLSVMLLHFKGVLNGSLTVTSSLLIMVNKGAPASLPLAPYDLRKCASDCRKSSLGNVLKEFRSHSEFDPQHHRLAAACIEVLVHGDRALDM